MIRRGEIYFADLDSVRGHEQAGTRPVLIVQNDVGNQFSSTTIVAAITSRIQEKRFPVHVEISGKESGLSKDSVILLDQLRTLDMGRLIRRVGQLSFQKMSDVDMGLRRSLALT